MANFLDFNGLQQYDSKIKQYITDKLPKSATTSTSGLLSSTDKKKLDGVESNANNYQHPTYTQVIGKPNDNLVPKFGESITITQVQTDVYGHVNGAYDRTITIPSSVATTTSAGLMSATDKANLDALNKHEFFKVVEGDSNGQPNVSVSDINEGTIYLVPAYTATDRSTNVYIEYIYVDVKHSVTGETTKKWEKVGELQTQILCMFDDGEVSSDDKLIEGNTYVDGSGTDKDPYKINIELDGSAISNSISGVNTRIDNINLDINNKIDNIQDVYVWNPTINPVTGGQAIEAFHLQDLHKNYYSGKPCFVKSNGKVFPVLMTYYSENQEYIIRSLSGANNKFEGGINLLIDASVFGGNFNMLNETDLVYVTRTDDSYIYDSINFTRISDEEIESLF